MHITYFRSGADNDTTPVTDKIEGKIIIAGSHSGRPPKGKNALY